MPQLNKETRRNPMKARTKRTILASTTCLIICSLPFLTLTTILGIDTLVDSYRNPHNYHYTTNTDTQGTAHFLITQTIPQTSNLHAGDTILYTDRNGIQTGTILALDNPDHLIYTTGLSTPIHPHEIIGKVTASLTQDPWSQLTLQLWDLTTQTLNPCTLLNL
jgi:hypothetical protein